MTKIASIVGARPQFIKAARVSNQIRKLSDAKETLIHTGQHYSPALSDIFFEELDIPQPDVHLGIGADRPAVQVGKMLIELDRVLTGQAYDWVIVYGDTTSTLAGALAAVKIGIPLAHVEAGLRSFNRQMPEEINRLSTDHLADLLFTPTATADQNLRNEGISEERISRVGDVMYDSVLYYLQKAREKSTILKELNVEANGYLLCTVHRAENTNDGGRLAAILEGLAAAVEQLPVILPLHPRTRLALEKHKLWGKLPEAIKVIEPVGYLDMLQLQAEARLVATDSGGVQKEAYFLGTPCVTLRDETEWVELVESGWNNLVPPVSGGAVAGALSASLNTPSPDSTREGVFGDGHAAERICTALAEA